MDGMESRERKWLKGMARKREPQHDWICRRCLCPCDPPGRDIKHVGGGQGMRACKQTPDPILREDYDAEMEESVSNFRSEMRRRRTLFITED